MLTGSVFLFTAKDMKGTKKGSSVACEAIRSLPGDREREG